MRKREPILSKISLPSIPKVLLREHLFRMLDSSRRYSVLWISGPPASGKTTLVNSYLKVRKLPAIYYRIDEEDSDIATFFYYMGIAIKKVSPRKRKPLPSYSTEYSMAINNFSRRYFDSFYNRLTAPFIIVLDNYQNVPDISVFHEMISYGLQEIPDGINVSILSRKAPLPAYAKLQANEKIHVIGWNDIQFTVKDTKKFLLMKGYKHLTDKTVSKLHGKTDGWIAGLILLCENLKGHNIKPHAVDRLPPTGIFNFFAYEIFKKIDEPVYSFLLKTAFFPRFTPHMARRISGSKNAEQILEKLFWNNNFITKYPSGETHYQYHPLFRDFLLSKVKDTFSPHELSLLKRKAIDILEESGHIEDSIYLSIEALELEKLAQKIPQYAHTFIEKKKTKTLLDWLEVFPHDILESDPWLLYWKAICLLPVNQSESQNLFEKAFYTFKSRNDIHGIFLSWAGIVESIIYGHDRLKLLDSWFHILIKLLKEYKEFPSETVEMTVTCSMVKALALRRPSFINVERWIKNYLINIEKSTDTIMKLKCLINQAYYRYSSGDLQSMKIILDSLDRLSKSIDPPFLSQISIFWLKAAYCNTTSQYKQCQETVSHGLEFIQNTGIHLMKYLLLGHGVLGSLKANDFITAQHYLEKMSPAIGVMNSWEAGFYHYCEAWAAMYHDDLSKAIIHSEHCLKICDEIGNPWTLSLACLLRAYISHDFGHDETNHVDMAYSIAVESKNIFSQFICLLTRAYFHIKKGEEEQALDSLRKGMSIGKEKGLINLYMCKPDVMKTLLTKAIEEDIEVRYCHDLIRKNALLADTPENEKWPWPLKIYTFGRFGLLRDGKPLKFSGKVQHKPLLLLKALISFGGRDVSEEKLVDTLWPDAEGDAAHSALTTNLSRLRNLLGVEHAIYCSDGKFRLDSKYCWVDVWAFERLLGKVSYALNDKLHERDMKKHIEIAEKAIKIYTGSFLSGDNEMWMMSIRERLRNKCLHSIEQLGNYFEHNGDLRQAVYYYEKGIEIDELEEVFYQHLMVCYQRLDQKAKALRVYQRCKKTLSSILCINPSQKTEAIYKEMKR